MQIQYIAFSRLENDMPERSEAGFKLQRHWMAYRLDIQDAAYAYILLVLIINLCSCGTTCNVKQSNDS